MTSKTVAFLGWSALSATVLALNPQPAWAQQAPGRCSVHELDVRIAADGTVAPPGDADAERGCYFVITVQNDSQAAQDVSMTLERNTPGGQRTAFDICQRRQLAEPRRAAPGLSQIACYVRPDVFAGLGSTTHPRDRNDPQGGPVERGFKYTLRVGSQVVDPDLVIRR